ncbi:cysteine proteinase [Tilletiaria anomala UBC 951]|uniref:Cysteine proteinase n=1 Tax=Tilletiaria anomala (strain ATCC 24038 / CBS 436.72 / UBC 951) TaxID=1037660 RepID=A0A066WF45_TILAU|nr:cysteine proteinase [Tilletiaria anomala UBC 951]KDN52602.1 cysteine proteinase [Tilletiaria anomala UBC 951]
MPPRATKRARRSDLGDRPAAGNASTEDASPTAASPLPPMPPPEEEPPLPPAEDGPPLPPVASSFVAPPPPPDEKKLLPTDATSREAGDGALDEDELMRRKRKLEELDEADAQQDASYWEKLANEKEEALKRENAQRNATLYLDTISRQHLDFDFERVCSVSLSPLHVYACLICGKYFQGRGPKSWASKHAVDEDHRVWMKLEEPGKGNVYILPEGTQVRDEYSLSALEDIKYLLDPTFSERQVRRLDAPDLRSSRDLQGRSYKPGFIGMNNLGGNDYMNVVIQALAHVKPLRDFLIRGRALPLQQRKEDAETFAGIDATSSSEFAARFSMLVRKVWNSRLFKPQVSPHEFLQEVNKASKGRFKLTAQGDPVEFLGWLLNQLHMDLGGGKKRDSIISATFRGVVRVESQKVFVRSGIELDDDGGGPRDKLDSDGRREGGQEDAQGNAKFNIDKEIQTNLSPFFLLAIDLPPPPVFQDVIEKNIIPQVPLASLISKYDGISFQEARGMIRRFKVMRLPPFVILHYRRFTKNNFVEERNPTIVNFPVKGLDLKETVVGEQSEDISTMYHLVANITHEATAGSVRENQVWRVQVHSRIDGEPFGHPVEASHRLKRKGRDQGANGLKSQADADGEGDDEADRAAEEKWYQIQDLIVEDINRQMLFLGETYVQIWERKDGSREVSEVMRRIAAKQVAEAKDDGIKSKPVGAKPATKSTTIMSNGPAHT